MRFYVGDAVFPVLSISNTDILEDSSSCFLFVFVFCCVIWGWGWALGNAFVQVCISRASWFVSKRNTANMKGYVSVYHVPLSERQSRAHYLSNSGGGRELDVTHLSRLHINR